MNHLCHAHNCPIEISPKLLMCPKHWKMVPVKIQNEIWKHYRKGQEDDKTPSNEYILTQRGAVWTVFVLEGGCTWEEVPEVETIHYMIGPRVIENLKKKKLEP